MMVKQPRLNQTPSVAATRNLDLLDWVDNVDAGSPGSVLFAIMGPSGAGKTTLMDIIAGRKRDAGVTGNLSVNGFPAPAQALRKLSG